MTLHCWWFGCEPHPEDPTPVEYLECQRCGNVMDYDSLTGYTRYRRFVAWLKWVTVGWWFPERCIDCGKRYGKHESCLPF